jgi:AraC-like DNA-binding protein
MYKHFKTSQKLSDYIDSFWWNENSTEKEEKMAIVPDGFFKIILILKEKKVIRYYLKGFMTKPQEIIVPPKTEGIGCRLKILAPEYILRRSIKHLVDSEESLPLEFLNARFIDFSNPEKAIKDLENSLLKQMVKEEVASHKLRLSQLLYQIAGGATVKEFGNQTFWAPRQINRYLNKYLGLNLKTFLKLLRAYDAYFKIREGDFSPTEKFYDQSHYIREIKEHAGASPKEIHKNENNFYLHIKNSRR